jgi:selenocysteine lyase/cysteine desulfurase
MRVLGVGSTARISAHLYNDAEDIAALVDGIAAAREFMAG